MGLDLGRHLTDRGLRLGIAEMHNDPKMLLERSGLIQAIGKGMQIPEQTLDPKIEQAASALWGWKLGKGKSSKDNKGKKRKKHGDHE